MKLRKWWWTTSSVVVGILIVLAFLVLTPQRGSASELVVPSAPGMEVSPGYGLDVDAGSVVTYTHVITNTGDDALFSVLAAASEGWPVDLVNVAYPQGTTVLMPFALQAGETATVGVRLTVPPGVAGGTVNTTAVTVSLLIDSAVVMRVVEDDIATVNLRYVYLPVVMRAYDPFANGDFSGGLAYWNPAGVLWAWMALDPDNPVDPVARLGSPVYACGGGVPMGYGRLSQHFSVLKAPAGKSVHLKFRYRIYTNDRNVGLTDAFDSFDVLVDGALAFRDANETSFDYCNVQPYDLGWRNGEIDLGGGGENVTLSFEVHNRADNWYNTYVLVDDVEMVIVD